MARAYCVSVTMYLKAVLSVHVPLNRQCIGEVSISDNRTTGCSFLGRVSVNCWQPARIVSVHLSHKAHSSPFMLLSVQNKISYLTACTQKFENHLATVIWVMHVKKISKPKQPYREITFFSPSTH